MMPEAQQDVGTSGNEMSIAQQEQDYFGPMDDPQLPQDVENLLKALAKKVSIREQWPRLNEVKAAAEQRFFYNNYQHIYWNNNAGCYQVGPGSSGVTIGGDSGATNRPRERKSFNIYLGYGKSFMAVFSQATPGTRFEADDPTDTQDIAAAQESDKMRQIVEKFNDPKALQIEVARYLWTDGRVVAFTDFVYDAEQFGVDAEGNPKGQEVIETFGVLETKIPLTAKNINNVNYCKISKEFAVSEMKSKFPQKASKISNGSKSSNDSDEIARNARIGIAEGTRWLGDDSISHLCTRDVYFFRPSTYWEFQESDRERLEEFFPAGCRATFVGATLCESRDDAMNDHISLMQAIPSDGQGCTSLGQALVSVQIDFNDGMDLLMETMKYTIPATWVDENGVDIDALQEQASEPGAHYPLQNRQPMEPAANMFYTEEAAEFPAAYMQFMENLQGPLAQFLTGQLPALFGGNMEDQKTAHGYAQARDQALGLLALNWLPFKKFYANVMQQAVRCAAAGRQDEDKIAVQMPDDDEPLTVEIANLQGNTICTPETDENFPESFTQKSNKYFALIQQAESNPVLAAELDTPENIELFSKMTGMPELKMKSKPSVDKQWKEIAELQKTVPVPDKSAMIQEVQQSQATGVPLQIDPATMPMKSSIDPDPEVDDSAIHYQTCWDWLNSTDGIRASTKNPDGYANVRFHMLQHKAILQGVQMPVIQPAAPQPNPQAVAPLPSPGAVVQ